MTATQLTITDFLSSIPSNPGSVPPLVHVTGGDSLYDILESKRLDPEKTTITADEKAVYLFVGKPAFKMKSKPDCEYWDAPVVFIFYRSAYRFISSMTALDSGAFATGRYSNILGSREINDFKFPASQKATASLIEAFFGSNDKYLASSARPVEEMREKFNILPSGFRILALAALYNSSRSNELDDRKSTAEARSTSGVPVTEGLLAGVVLPEEWDSDVAHVRSPLEKMGCQVETYEIYPIDRTHYTSELYRLTRKIIREKSLHG